MRTDPVGAGLLAMAVTRCIRITAALVSPESRLLQVGCLQQMTEHPAMRDNAGQFQE
jgi:hypothetical protein